MRSDLNRAGLRIIKVGIIVIVTVIPFQATLTTWLGANFGLIDLFRIWKELLLFVLCLMSLGLIWHNPTAKAWIFDSWLNKLMFVFSSFLVIMTLFGVLTRSVSPSAAIYGLLVDGRLFAVFVLVTLGVKLGLRFHNWPMYIVVPALIVAIFGLLQLVILPDDFLRHFGYGPSTMPAAHYVDNKPDYQRIQSTLRGPNPLGAYLVVIVPLAAAFSFKRYGSRPWFWLYGLVAASAVLVVLFGTYSRSAWLGMVTALIVFLLCSLRLPKMRLWIATGGLLLVTGFGGTVYALRGSERVKTFCFIPAADPVRSKAQTKNAQMLFLQG